MFEPPRIVGLCFLLQSKKLFVRSPLALAWSCGGPYPAIYSFQVLMKLFVVLAVLGSCSAFAPAAGVRPAVARRSALTVRQVAPVMELETVDTWCAAPAQWP